MQAKKHHLHRSKYSKKPWPCALICCAASVHRHNAGAGAAFSHLLARKQQRKREIRHKTFARPAQTAHGGRNVAVRQQKKVKHAFICTDTALAAFCCCLIGTSFQKKWPRGREGGAVQSVLSGCFEACFLISISWRTCNEKISYRPGCNGLGWRRDGAILRHPVRRG